MHLMALPFPTIDPVAIGIGPVEIRWYGLAYLAGLILGWLYMRALARNAAIWGGQSPIDPDKVDDFLIYATIGVIVGGRLGFVLFYEPGYFLEHPLEIFALWGGGMAFHGGLLGVGLATYIFARRNNIPVFSVMDLAAAATPFGLFFGRIANFINGEIYGRLTDVPWAVEFPPGVLMEGHAFGPRHPTQIYEAILEGIVLFIALRYLTHRRGAMMRPGVVAGAFLMIYGGVRIFAEFFKEWDYGQFFTTAYFSSGMVYSLPMIALGLYFYLRATPDGFDRVDRAGVHLGRGLERIVSSIGFLVSRLRQAVRKAYEVIRDHGQPAFAASVLLARPAGIIRGFASMRVVSGRLPNNEASQNPGASAADGLVVTAWKRLGLTFATLRNKLAAALLWIVNGLIGSLVRVRNALMRLAHQPLEADHLLPAPIDPAQAASSRHENLDQPAETDLTNAREAGRGIIR